jgi:hypothetical protein
MQYYLYFYDLNWNCYGFSKFLVFLVNRKYWYGIRVNKENTFVPVQNLSIGADQWVLARSDTNWHFDRVKQPLGPTRHITAPTARCLCDGEQRRHGFLGSKDDVLHAFKVGNYVGPYGGDAMTERSPKLLRCSVLPFEKKHDSYVKCYSLDHW